MDPSPSPMPVGSPAPQGLPEPADPPAPVGAPPTGIDRRRVLWLSALITFCALCGIALLVYLGWNIGPLALGVGIASAILPVPVLVACFLWLDRYQPSPLWI